MRDQATLPVSRKAGAQTLFAPLGRSYDRMGALLSFGQDPRWRAAMVAAVDAEPHERVLDVATGTGMVAEALVRAYSCHVVALDQSPEMLACAGARLARNAALGDRVVLETAEAESLPFADAEFDHLTFTYLLRYVDDPAATMAELARVVKPGGRVASLEFGVPPNPMLRVAWRAYTLVGLPALGRLASPAWAHTGSFLARSIPELYARHPLDRIAQMWREAGIEAVQVKRMSFGAGVVMWGIRGP
jgi:demethylmenaquinone methyltransferase/2-methoxy-6-polyprenyl-1,4-benzoquinol methylase